MNITALQLLPDLLDLNLDCYNDAEPLNAIEQELKQASSALRLLAKYAKLKSKAIEFRKAGDISLAIRHESECDIIYKRLPESFKTW